MKKTILGIITLSVVFAASQSEMVSVKKLAENQNFTLNIHSEKDVMGLQFDLKYNPNELKFNGAVSLLDGFTFEYKDKGDGQVFEFVEGGWQFDVDDINGIDDDFNGKPDDFVGWNFRYNNNDPSGSYYHGTSVGGIIAARTNNIEGIAGVVGGWSNDHGISMMSIWIDDEESGNIVELFENEYTFKTQENRVATENEILFPFGWGQEISLNKKA
ncbi:MAG: hypothetical protein H8E60_10410 [Candidatus Marinimicrobia bacterium]|nr:hypothetical protein [Candidatus Neomarinimicrobiota bacterium]